MNTGNGFRFGKFILAIPFISLFYSHDYAITAEQAKISIEAFNKVYWRQANKTFFKYDNQTGELDYWMWAHAWETEMDAYERTRDPFYLQKIRDCHDGFVARFGTDLSARDYNDDIGWWVMAAARAYDLTGVVEYRTLARKNFDWMYATQVDTVFGGGIWWKNTERGQKNSASTLPFSVAGFKLARQLSDPGYADKAGKLHAWVRLRLFRTYGEVADRIERRLGKDTVFWGPLSYNHGTFVSSAWEMFKVTRDSTHFKDAIATLEYFKNILSDKTTGILPDERGDGTGNTDNDAGMYKTVFVHYAMRFLMEAKQWQYLPWMNANAESLWKNRRQSDNLMYFAWATPAPAQLGKIGAQMASGGVSLLNLLVVAEGMQARYSEGIDTTNAQGQGLGNAFTVAGTGISANGNRLVLYHFDKNNSADALRLFSHSFQDIQKVPADFSAISTGTYAGMDIINHAFVLRLSDTTYAKVIILKKLPDSRYLYRYGISKVRNNTLFAESDYPRSARQKVNNFQIQTPVANPVSPGATISNFKWEPPLENDNRLTGYQLFYIDVSKADTAKPANLADWTLMTTTSQTNFTWSRVGDNQEKYLNIVAVYESGRSAPLEGWVSIMNGYKTPTYLDPKAQPRFSLEISGNSLAYTLPKEGRLSLDLHDFSGRFLQTLYSEFQNPGSHTLSLPKAGSGSGSYILRIGFEIEKELRRYVPLR